MSNGNETADTGQVSAIDELIDAAAALGEKAHAIKTAATTPPVLIDLDKYDPETGYTKFASVHKLVRGHALIDQKRAEMRASGDPLLIKIADQTPGKLAVVIPGYDYSEEALLIHSHSLQPLVGLSMAGVGVGSDGEYRCLFGSFRPEIRVFRKFRCHERSTV